LDDGTAGLWTVKNYGGIAIVQDPKDAEVPSMPENALREVNVDHAVPIAAMADLMVRLTKENPDKNNGVMKDEQTKKEIQIAAEDGALNLGMPGLGELTPFSCPECHGVLSKLKDGNLARYRCHTGHAYSVDTLLASISEKIEDSLYSAIRGIDESIMLLNHIGDHYAEVNHAKLAALYFQKAKEAEARSNLVRKAVLSNEQFSKDALLQQVLQNEENKKSET
jgi:two-component system chemotaxis response regulator CheB